jgi:outer membrane protein TolC
MNNYLMKKSSIRIFFLVLAAILVSFPRLSAQETVRLLSLEEALEISQSQSHDALIAKQSFRANYWDYRSYQASNLPALSFEANGPNINQTIVSQSIDGIVSYASYKGYGANANLSLTQKIGITGGTVAINSYLQGQFNVDGTNDKPYLSYPVNIVFNQPLFQYNAWRWDKKIKPLKYAMAKRKYIEDREQIAITATNYFFVLLQAQIEKKIALTNLSNYDTLYRIAKGRYQLGKIAESDLLQLELNFLKAQAQVENAELGLDNAQFRFKSYLRLQDSIKVRLSPPDNISFFIIEPLKAVDLAKQNSSTSLDFNRRLLEAASSVNLAKSNGRFDANIQAVIGLNQQGPTIPDAYHNPGDQRQVSIGMTVPIVDWGVARGQIKMAQSQQEIVKNSVEQEIIDFQRNVYLKVVQFNMQKNQVRIAAKSDTVARKSYEVTKGRYLIGKINSIMDLYLSQIETDNAEKNYYYALQTFWRSYYEIRKLTLYDFIKNKPLIFDPKDIK